VELIRVCLLIGIELLDSHTRIADPTLHCVLYTVFNDEEIAKHISKMCGTAHHEPQ
jgi:hypothetical protein